MAEANGDPMCPKSPEDPEGLKCGAVGTQAMILKADDPILHPDTANLP